MKKMMIKAAVIYNGGYRGRRIFETNGKVFLPHSLYLIIFETPFLKDFIPHDIANHVMHPHSFYLYIMLSSPHDLLQWSKVVSKSWEKEILKL